MDSNRNIYINLSLLTLIFLIISGCAHKPNLSPEYELPDSDAILLIGIESASFRIDHIVLSLGEIEEDNWYSIRGITPNFVIVEPKDDFIIAKLTPTNSTSRYVANNFIWKDLRPANFRAKKYDKVPSFEAIGGKVNYVGTLLLELHSSERMSFTTNFDSDKARKYIENNYPHILPKLEFKQLTFSIVGN
jgi:hypothetical protein